jgi:hypothetical protein
MQQAAQHQIAERPEQEQLLESRQDGNADPTREPGPANSEPSYAPHTETSENRVLPPGLPCGEIADSAAEVSRVDPRPGIGMCQEQ